MFKVLDDYEVPLDHVLCCVTDNATNMVKLVTTMNEVKKFKVSDLTLHATNFFTFFYVVIGFVPNFPIFLFSKQMAIIMIE